MKRSEIDDRCGRRDQRRAGHRRKPGRALERRRALPARPAGV